MVVVATMMTTVPIAAEAEVHTGRAIAMVVSAAAPFAPPVMTVTAAAVVMPAVHGLNGATGRLRLRSKRRGAST